MNRITQWSIQKVTCFAASVLFAFCFSSANLAEAGLVSITSATSTVRIFSTADGLDDSQTDSAIANGTLSVLDGDFSSRIEKSDYESGTTLNRNMIKPIQEALQLPQMLLLSDRQKSSS